MSEISRRGFITAAGGALAAAWLMADPARLRAAGMYAANAGRSAPPPPFEVFTASQAADLEAAMAQIIPTDDTPGAKEARVVYFADKALATWQKDQKKDVLAGIAELNLRARRAATPARSFAALQDAQQRLVIASLEKDKHPFFAQLRGITLAGMFANPEYGGNAGKVGWKLIGFDDRFSWTAPFGWYDANAR